MHTPINKTNAIVEIIATIRFKIWVDRDMIDQSGEYTLEAIAQEYLSLHVNDFPTMQADIESVDSAKVLDEGPYELEAVECSSCGACYFERSEVEYIAEYGVCRLCPDPKQEEIE